MTILMILAAVLMGTPQSCSDDNLEELRLAFSPAEDPAAAQDRRDRALDGISGTACDSPALVAALVDAMVQLRKEFLPLKKKRGPFLAGDRTDGELKLTDEELKLRANLDHLNDLQERIHSALLGLKNPSALIDAVERAFDDKKMDLTLRIALAGRVDLLGESACKKIIPLLNGSNRAAGRLVALEAARVLGKKGRSLENNVLGCLRHYAPVVREAAAAALAAISLPESIEPLVARLAVEKGRTQHRIYNALQVLTGQALGTSSQAWQRWLAEEGQPFLTGKVPLGGGVVFPKDWMESSYYGIPIDGFSTVYIFDCSLSMSQGAEEKNDAIGPPAKECGETRFDRARNELFRALRSHQPQRRLNIIAFDGRCRFFQTGMFPAWPDRIENACKWFDKLEPKSGTPLYDALDLSFAMAGRLNGDRFFSSAIDTIFVITDGVPCIDSNVDPVDRIRDAVRRWNLNRHVMIHVIGLGNKLQAEKFQAFANENGGKFVHDKSD
jgi:hypothetical protein